MTGKLTPMQATVMHWVAYNEMTENNGGEPDHWEQCDCFLWIDEIASELGISTQAARGVVGSLVAEGYLETYKTGDKQNPHGVCFTELGWHAWRAVLGGGVNQ